MNQLIFDFARSDYPGFDKFLGTANRELIYVLQQAQDQFVYVWGQRGSGKSHLLKAWVAQAREQGHHAVYIDAETAPLDETALSAEYLAVDGADRLQADEQALLFEIFNRFRNGARGRLLLSADVPPQQLTVREDLRTRMGYCLVYDIKPLSDEEKIDALVGTQMLSKGHDYHNVGLAVIMGVDELLNFPDFRARERTLALSMQVAGRAGRSGEGRVVVQSRQREFFENFIEDYDAFLAEEIAAREPLYPPFARLLRAVVADKSEQSAKQKLEACMAELDALRVSEPDLQIVGHGKCAIEILGGKFRFEILLRCISHAPLIKAARICATHGFDVDMDPINFS